MQKPDYILLIDDDQTANFLNKALLQKAGMTKEIHVAENGKAALDILHALESKAGTKERKLCIFLDLDMPLLNGYEVLAWLKKKKFSFQVQVYVLSILLESRVKEHLQGYPIVKFIPKPLSLQLIKEIASAEEVVNFN